MNWYLFWYLCIGSIALVTLSRAGRVFGAGLSVWRGRIAELLVRNILIGIGLPLFAEWLVVFMLIITPPDELSAPGGGFMLVMAVIIAGAGVVGAVRETRAWIAWIAYYRGAALLSDKRYVESLTLYERTLHRHPKLAGAWVGKAVTLYRMGRGIEALVAIERALVLGPKLAQAWVWKARILTALRGDIEALMALNRALELAPHTAVVWAQQGDTLARLGRYAEALGACQRAQDKKLARDHSPASHGLALATMATALNGLGRSAEALDAAERAIALNPYPVRSRLAQAVAQERLGRPEEALAAAEQGLAVAERYLLDEPSMIAHAEVWSAKAALLRQLGRAGEADTAEARSQALYAAIRGEVGAAR